MYIIYVFIYLESHVGTQKPKSMVGYAGGSCWTCSPMKLKRSWFALKVTAYCCTCVLSCGLSEINLLFRSIVFELEERAEYWLVHFHKLSLYQSTLEDTKKRTKLVKQRAMRAEQ